MKNVGKTGKIVPFVDVWLHALLKLLKLPKFIY